MIPSRYFTNASLTVFFVLLASSMGRAQQDPPTVTPPGGYSGFPTLAADDGRFVAIAQGLSTLGVPAVSGLNFSVCVPDTETNLDLWVFDGETGNTIATGSFWDITRPDQNNNDDFEYNLYPDKDLVGNLTGQLENVDASTLADNDWDNFITRALAGDAADVNETC